MCTCFGGHMYAERRPTNTLWKLAADPQELFVWSEIQMTNKENTPSPRYCHTGWKYAEKLWTFGGDGAGNSSAGFLHKYGDFDLGYNNQLLCFNPSAEEWANPQCYGRVPEPRGEHATTISQDKVWLYKGCVRGLSNICHDLHELDMRSYTWTLIQTQQKQSFAFSFCTLSIMSDDKLVVHGGYTANMKRSSHTWILDLETKTWKRYTSNVDFPRSNHTSSRGINNSVVNIGGFQGINGWYQTTSTMYKTTFHILLEPKSMKQLAMQNVYKHHTLLPWKCLPRKLKVLLDIQETGDADKVSNFTPE